MSLPVVIEKEIFDQYGDTKENRERLIKAGEIALHFLQGSYGEDGETTPDTITLVW